MWQLNYDWDDEVPDDLLHRWKQWKDDLGSISQVRIPRHMFQNEAGVKVELHAFCDASEKAFCAVCYFRWQGQDGVKTSFVMARVRVAPVKTLTIPRLELQAAVLATRMVTTVLNETRTQVQKVIYWSDSQTALAWIKSEQGRFNTFVNNRTAEIRDVSRPDQWRYVPSALNAADAGSRGQTLEEVQSRQWLCGPSFLREDEEDWPQDVEQVSASVTNATAAQEHADISSAMPDISRFSRWTTAVRCVCTVRRWLTRHRDGRRGEFSADEVAAAEDLWIRLAQTEGFKTEREELRRCGQIHPKSGLKDLSPMLKDGVIVVDSRVCRSPDVSVTARYPPILPRKHRYTQLLMLHVHQQMAHQAHAAVLTELRQRCWIPRAATTLRSVVSRCQLCRLRKSKPVSVRMAPLPLSRVSKQDKAFSSTGVDIFGPIGTSVGRATKIVWVVIFRCMATKAVHFEIVDSLSTDSTLMAITRFQSRRGHVRSYFSDNGRNFVGANRALVEQQNWLDHDEISRKLAIRGTQWRFKTPCDPSAGGVWERNICTAKDILYSLLQRQTPRHEVLVTLLAEVERIMNSTPIVEVSTDSTDDDPLTPYHFLIGSASPCQPRGDPVAGTLRQRWQVAQNMAEHFWRRWVREYLPRLSTRTKWRQEGGDLQEGSIVIIADEEHPRNVWLRGRVLSVMRGPDGRVRSATVQTRLGTLRRPAHKLIVIDTSRP